MSGLLLAALALACSFTIDGGDVEQQRPLPTPPADCLQAWAEVRESRRLIRNTAITGGLVAGAQFLDIGSTAWADNQFACRDTAPGQVCLVEWNTLTPTSLGLVAAKVGITLLVTAISYLADRAGHTGFAQVFRWLGVAAGVIPAAINVHRGLTVEKARATP